ncbi:MAG: TonB family protein [Candidatus Coatesbacteria bacterium]|nr:TonB family protein [Candidatus Coatesbacteria bacterium]
MNAALVLEHKQKLDRRRLVLAVFVGILFHLWLFYFTFPETMGPVWEEKKHVTRIRGPLKPPKKEEIVKPPPPKKTMTEKPKAIVPVPDPTPDQPEPVQELEPEPQIEDIPLDEDFIWGIPDAPDIPVGGRETEEDMKIYNQWEVSQAPEVVRKVIPSYPELAREAGKEALVVLALVVDKNGDVQSHEILYATGDTFKEKFIKEAVMAAYRYKFKPAIQSGHPVACLIKINIAFKLGE